MKTIEPTVMVRGERRRTLMRELGWRGLCPPGFREIDRELLLDDVVARRPELRADLALGEPRPEPATMLLGTPALAEAAAWMSDPGRGHALVYIGGFGEGKSLALGFLTLHWPGVLGGGLPVFADEVTLIKSLNHAGRNKPDRTGRVHTRVSAALGVQATKAPLLAIDESAVKADLAPWEIEVYQRWLAERYTRMGRYTLVSANPRGVGAPEDAIEARVGSHVWDRWGDQGDPRARLGPKPMRLRQSQRVRERMARYREQLRTAYQERRSAPATPAQRQQVRRTVAGLGAQVREGAR